jgi:uncharacterized protein
MKFARSGSAVLFVSLALIAEALTTGDARGASFDCAKATPPIEKLICGDPTLSAADEAIAIAWQAALAASLDRTALRDEQRSWQHKRPATAPELEASYRRRIDKLNDETAKWRAMPRTFAVTELNASCFTTPEADADLTCHVEESGKVGGGDKLSYQLQGFFDGDLRMNGGAVIFAEAAATLSPLLTAFDDTTHYNQPEVVRSAAGTLLWIPGHMEGTGNFNTGRLYIWSDGVWQDVDTKSWQGDMARRFPHGLYAAKGIYPDYRTMTGATPLWRPEDANCCAKGGRATFRLGLKDRRLGLDDLRTTLGRAAAERE